MAQPEVFEQNLATRVVKTKGFASNIGVAMLCVLNCSIHWSHFFFCHLCDESTRFACARPR